MTPHERLKQRAKQWIHQGCTTEVALQKALQELNNLTIQARELQDIKHQIELEIALKEEPSKETKKQRGRGAGRGGAGRRGAGGHLR